MMMMMMMMMVVVVVVEPEVFLSSKAIILGGLSRFAYVIQSSELIGRLNIFNIVHRTVRSPRRTYQLLNQSRPPKASERVQPSPTSQAQSIDT
jgi:hypothetical protein